MDYVPSWQDTIFETGLTELEWTLVYDDCGTGVTAFNGKSWAADGDTLKINVGRLMRDFLCIKRSGIESGLTVEDGALASFALVSGSTTLGEWTVRLDYSWEPWAGEDKVLSEPINGHADMRQFLIMSQYLGTQGTTTIVYE